MKNIKIKFVRHIRAISDLSDLIKIAINLDDKFYERVIE